MRLFSAVGEFIDSLLIDYWKRLKERRAYLTQSLFLFAILGGIASPSKYPVLVMIGLIGMWVLYVLFGPHKEDTDEHV